PLTAEGNGTCPGRRGRSQLQGVEILMGGELPMIEELRKEFRQYLKENQLWYPGQRILLACSGGVDSMVLAHLLKVEDINFALAHCHFQLRGEASDLDAALVEDWAREHGLAFFQTRFET